MGEELGVIPARLLSAETLGDTFPGLGEVSRHCGDLLAACGFEWDAADIARFLDFCEEDHNGCLIWQGARSRGRGNTDWYGSFRTQKKTVRAHKFYGVAVLGHRPRTGVHHLDHTCTNSLCVRHVDCVPEAVNLKLRWVRVQVGLDPEPDKIGLIKLRMEAWLLEDQRLRRFDPEDALRLQSNWVRPEYHYIPDIMDPRFW